ncbi:squamous cell carcinoma antigen recognized by T-cells 3-like [Pistacia vera]|uniref:squamous cell carcinoma antigen recognized by T-cells 3-like n=1 Tax=Pistacia vera TaxID=55513 RepID=UPI0012632804|nr:squamous cell carcinoma antigen recognized by T-cells 3-like [Pistacia vera]
MEPEDQTLAPKTQEEEDTDTAMADTNENPEAIEPESPDSSDLNSDLEYEAQQKFELQDIEALLANEPSNYEVHVQYIRVLRKMGEIEKLRQAREAMNEIFPLTLVMWQEWA